jgi:putative ABC transport system permease protein
VVYKENNMQASVYGVAPDYLIVRNSSIAYGSFITQENIDNIDKVAVIGSTTASTLF